MIDADIFRKAILYMHGCDSRHVATVPVHELFEGKTVWQGEVEVFDLVGHHQAARCYAWAYRDGNGQAQFTAVLELPPVQSAQQAVRAALVEQAKNAKKDS